MDALFDPRQLSLAGIVVASFLGYFLAMTTAAWVEKWRKKHIETRWDCRRCSFGVSTNDPKGPEIIAEISRNHMEIHTDRPRIENH